jgi:uncharacterized membrane protein HdeD (DUF308 family)
MEATDRPMATRVVAERATSMWWLFLVTGIAWLLVSVIVLRFDVASIAAVGTLVGVVLLFAGANEFLIMGMREIGWKWLHAVLGVLFIVGGVWAFVHPIDAFWELASIIGFLLVLKGSLDVVGSVMQRDVSELWWLGLLAGVLEILLGFWASQQFFAPRAILILIWVGFLALFRGFTEIVMAFELRSAHKRMERM